MPDAEAFGQVIEELEEAQTATCRRCSMRHVTPFREEVQFKLTELCDTTDTLELWVKVQMMWTSLESVFMGGDIAKQMPLEAKKFAKIDKDWIKIMTKPRPSAGRRAVLRQRAAAQHAARAVHGARALPEEPRGLPRAEAQPFPRFYFVSNPVLLLILSQGSDPLQMQTYYEKVFDSITRVSVVHDKKDKTIIPRL